MDNDTEILCEAVRDSYADGVLVSLYGIKCIFSVIAIPPALVICIAIVRASALHRNIRLLFVNLFIATIIANIGIILVGSYHVLALITSNTNEELCAKVAMTGRECLLLQGPSILGGFTVSTSLIFLAIERLCATVQFKTYENNGGRKLGVTLAALQWILSIPTLPLFGGAEQRYPFCQGTAISPHLSQQYLTFMLVAQLSGLLTFVALIRVNKRKMERFTFNSALKLLSVRFQLKENVDTTKLMIPVSVTSCFITVIPFVADCILLVNLPDNAKITEAYADLIIAYARWCELALFMFPIYSFTLCTVVICYSNHIRLAAKKLTRCIIPECSISPSVSGPEFARKLALETEQTKKRYFDALKKQWDHGEPSSQSKTENSIGDTGKERFRCCRQRTSQGNQQWAMKSFSVVERTHPISHQSVQ